MGLLEYSLADITTAVYADFGTFEDWAYAAGWDTSDDAVL